MSLPTTAGCERCPCARSTTLPASVMRTAITGLVTCVALMGCTSTGGGSTSSSSGGDTPASSSSMGSSSSSPPSPSSASGVSSSSGAQSQVSSGPVSSSGPAPVIQRVNVSDNGEEAGGAGVLSAVSADGRFVVFDSWAGLDGVDNNGQDVFLRDLMGATTRRVSLRDNGTEGMGSNGFASVSSSGRWVAFQSSAGDLLTPPFSMFQVLVKDRMTGALSLASVSNAGQPANDDVYGEPMLAESGACVVFSTAASNLVPGDTNGFSDVFLHDLQDHTTHRISMGINGSEPNASCDSASVSADCRRVAFNCFASNIIPGGRLGHDIYVHDRMTGDMVLASPAKMEAGGSTTPVQGNDRSRLPRISAGGQFVVFSSLASDLVAGDTNAVGDIFLRDLMAGTTVRISVSSAGAEGNLASYVFNEQDEPAGVAADGKRVVFRSYASNLVADDTNGQSDIFVRNVDTATTRRVSVSASGVEANEASYRGGISSDGRFVSFTSRATNLVALDTNHTDDFFLVRFDPQ